MAEQYSETVSTPRPVLLAISALISVVVTLTIGAAMIPVVDSIPAELPFLLSVFGVCWVFMSLALLLTKNIKIKIREMKQYSGQRGPTLFIRFSSRDSKTYIPLHRIDEVKEVSFGGPWWNTSMIDELPEPEVTSKEQSWWRNFLLLRDKDGPIPLGGEALYGYRGPGLLITFRAKNLASAGEEYLWKCQFPTRNPRHLKSILESAN